MPVRYDTETIPQEYMAAVTNMFAALLRVAEEEHTPNELGKRRKRLSIPQQRSISVKERTKSSHG